MFSTRICGTLGRADLREHRVDGGDLLVAILGAGVDHVQQQVGVGGFGERRAKRRDQVVRQVADEPDGIRQHDRLRAGHVDPAQRRVERREQLVGGVDAGAASGG